MNWLQQLIDWLESKPRLARQVFVPVLESKPMDNMPTAASTTLYETAKASLGQHLAPENPFLGCALTVNALAKKAWGHEIGGGASTQVMLECLRDLRKYKPVLLSSALPGDIIIAATGSPQARLTHGHVGVVAKYGICSNSSETGTLEENYSINSWVAYFTAYGGIPTLVFRAL